MRVAVTGASGFVGRWLVAELESAGHIVVSSPTARVDVRDASAVRRWIEAARPDAIAHLAAIAAPGDVAADPSAAREIAVAGTRNMIDALAAAAHAGPADAGPPVVLVTGSSEVYGPPTDLPLVETMAIDPRTPYARVKAEQEAVALEEGRRLGIRVVATRSFNHTGPGQTTDFAIPAFASRIVEARQTGRTTFAVGNLDVRRDLSDVRDVVVAYRLLIEHAATAGDPPTPGVVNVGSGRAVLLRDVVATLIRLAGDGLEPRTDPALVRDGDAPEIRADISRLQEVTGWRPRIDLETTLRDILAHPAIGENGGGRRPARQEGQARCT